jgi:hypothetical protein
MKEETFSDSLKTMHEVWMSRRKMCICTGENERNNRIQIELFSRVEKSGVPFCLAHMIASVRFFWAVFGC